MHKTDGHRVQVGEKGKGTEISHEIGASLKDLGKKFFAFSRLYMEARELMRKIDPQNF